MAKVSKYPPEWDAWLRENRPSIPLPQLADRFNAVFGTDKTESQLHAYCKKHKIRSKLVQRYTPEQIAYIHANGSEISTKELARELNERFGTSHSEASVNVIAKRIGIRKSDACKRRTHSEKGMPIGTIFVVNGRKYIKVRSGNRFFKNCEPLSNHVWKQANGEIPEDHRIVFLNRDAMDCRLENLALVHKSVLARMANGRGKTFWNENSDITKAGIKICELDQTLYDLED